MQERTTIERTIEVSTEEWHGGGYFISLNENEDAHARALGLLHRDPVAVQAVVKHDDRPITLYTQGDQDVEGQLLTDAASVNDAVRTVAMALASEAREYGDTMRYEASKRDEHPRPDIRGPKPTDYYYRQHEKSRQAALNRRNVVASVAHNLGIWDAFNAYLRAMEGPRGESR